MKGIGGHHSPAFETDVWLTPPHILAALGTFDLDPCAAPDPKASPTARSHFVRAQNGLAQPWAGRVWLNPPYGGPAIVGPWMRRMARHGNGTALIFARTETALFFETVWDRATAVLFLRGRLFFLRPNGGRGGTNAGAPSVLVAYGEADAAALASSGIDGKLIELGE